ncbi:hypothetical protein EJ02DRAFT_473718 [Clathrospora elynae]|uniref:Uncharacterized protein n=1 Tax=Clathrospora elynae TaxID=706981 RepID=A0A6A5T1I8_9PLEO|nr:hypothetical protein EJ02DRAFT_473718 [Clathrospora elynae]
MKGNVLFTRYSYHLTSPARSHTVGGSLKKLLTGGFTNEEKTKIPCSINSTEKVLSRALLGIRGVKQVIIEGTGRMEGDFAETIKATLVQPPGTNIIESNNPDLPSSTHQVNGFGKARSKVYGPRALNPYPTRPKTFQSRPSNYETITAQRKRDQSKRWDLKDMVQIMARKQDLEDRGLSKMTPDPDRYYNLCLPLVLTGKGGTVELGWKV